MMGHSPDEFAAVTPEERLVNPNLSPGRGLSSTGDRITRTPMRRVGTLGDILQIEPPKPVRGRGHPPPDEATLQRRALAVWLIESGTLSRSDVELLVGRKTWAINAWRRQARRAS